MTWRGPSPHLGYDPEITSMIRKSGNRFSKKIMLKQEERGLPVALMPVADALAAILDGADPLPEEMVALDAAFHRTLARDVAAKRTQPPQPMSAMDGYAVRAADAAAPGARLKVIGEVAARRPFEKKV